jgi:tetratricopeptide (TPR) repeat protein
VGRRTLILFLFACAGGAGSAEGQIFAPRTNVGRLGSPITSPLLDRMFARTSLLAPTCRQPCVPFGSRSVGFNFYADGTPFDPFAVGSFPERFQNSASLYSNTALSAALRGTYISSNMANVQAPADYRLTPPSLETHVNELTPHPIGGGWTMGTAGPLVTLPPLMTSLAPVTTLTQTAWARPAQTPMATEIQRPAGPADLAMRIGDKSFKRGEYALARDDYRRALARDDDEPTVLLALGLAEFARGRWPAASKAVAQGIKLGPTLDPTTFDLRTAYGRPGDFEKHLARLEAAAAKTPGDAGLWLLVGYVRYFSGNPAGGRAAWDQYSAMPGADSAIKSYVQNLPAAPQSEPRSSP